MLQLNRRVRDHRYSWVPIDSSRLLDVNRVLKRFTSDRGLESNVLAPNNDLFIFGNRCDNWQIQSLIRSRGEI